MLKSKNLALGNATRWRTALAIGAATFLVGGSITEASAKSRHHHRHHHSHHASNSSWRDAKAAVAPSSGSGRSFSGMASFYGNEYALTAAHRSLPFGTKLRVSLGGRCVVVTINDRGPFIRGRVLDLSTGAARAIGLTSAGVGRVTAEVVS